MKSTGFNALTRHKHIITYCLNYILEAAMTA